LPQFFSPEAKELFIKKQWHTVLVKLEALQYLQFMDAVDKRRLEIARERSQRADDTV
jgi:hypothetical protein